MAKNTQNSDKKHTPRSSEAVVDQRVADVIEFILRGMNRRDMFKFITTNEKFQWDITINMLDRYIASAKDIIKESGVFSKDEETGKAIERLNNLYARSYLLNDFKTCLAVQKELSELTGLKVERLEHSGTGFVLKIIDADSIEPTA